MLRACRVFAMAAAVVVSATACSSTGLPTTVPLTSRITCFDLVPVSLKDAVQTAEIKGGKAIEASFRQTNEMACLEGDAGHYDVTLLIGDQLLLVRIDAETREIQADTNPQTLIMSNSVRSRLAIAQRAKMGLGDAVTIAEARGGKAREAHPESSAGKAGYIIRLIDRGTARIAWVDGT